MTSPERSQGEALREFRREKRRELWRYFWRGLLITQIGVFLFAVLCVLVFVAVQWVEAVS